MALDNKTGYIRYGKAFRMRGIGHETLCVTQMSHDERRFYEIVNAMSPEDAAVLGRICDPEWYDQNDKDIAFLEAKTKQC